MDILGAAGPLIPFAVVGSFTPGPNNILVMSHGISHGFRATLPYQMGMGVACMLIIGIVLLLGAQLEKVLPPVMVAMRYVGCAYMLWLAWVVGSSPAPAVGNSPEGEAEAAQRIGRSAVTWRTGFVLQFINPKFYLYTLTLAAVLAPVVRSALDLSAYSVFFAVIAVAGTILWAAAGALLQNFLRRWHRATSLFMAAALVWCAVTLF